MTAAPRLICKIASSVTIDDPTEAINAEGISKTEIANANNEDAVCATCNQLVAPQEFEPSY